MGQGILSLVGHLAPGGKEAVWWQVLAHPGCLLCLCLWNGRHAEGECTRIDVSVFIGVSVNLQLLCV